MTLKKLDFKSNTFEVLGVSIQFGRVINRDVKFSSVFHWKINQNKFIAKGQLNSEWIYEVIVSPKMPTKNFSDFWPGGLLEGRAEIWEILAGILGETMTS